MTKQQPTGANLGRSQQTVLHLLAIAPRTARHIEYDHFGLTESAARSAIGRLEQRKLVEAVGWDDSGRRRMYGLTDRGRAVEAALDVQIGEDDG